MRLPGAASLGRVVRSMARPGPITAALATLGVVTFVAFALIPVDAALGRDPLLDLGSLGAPERSYPARVDCGSALSSLGSSESVDFYGIAHDRVCGRAARRRVAGGAAAGAVIVMTALLALTVASRRDQESPPLRSPSAALS